jgi:uncharacterized protein (TIGR00369 family)
VHGRGWVLREDYQRRPCGSADHEASRLEVLEFDASQQLIKVQMQARPEFINPAGVIHGGMLAAMLDETLSPALAATLGPGEFAPTLETKVNFITPAKVGRVLGTGRIVRRGRSICFMDGQLHDEHGRLLATAMATSKIGRQS